FAPFEMTDFGRVVVCRLPRWGAAVLRPYKKRNERLHIEVALNELAELVAVFVFHVDKLDAASVGANIANDGGEIDFAKACANFKLDGVADTELAGRFEISASEADGLDAGKAGGCTLNLCTKRRLQRNANVAARNYIGGARCGGRFVSGANARGRSSILEERQGIFSSGAKTGRLGILAAVRAL